MRTYLDPTAPIASDAIVVDDPKLAMDLAIAICESPRMSNLAHGLWGYHGTTREGAELTVQSLGIGGPSAAAVVADLAGLGVARAVRIGSCISLEPALEPGSSLIASSFVPADGAGRILSGGRNLEPDEALTAAVAQATEAGARGPVRSADILGYQAETDGAIALDLSSAAFAGACSQAGIACAAALAVSRSAQGSGPPHEVVDEALIALGVRVAAALQAVAQASGS
ncbi:MAG: hypothetical protein M3Y34_00270 [Actinomycetota bacterium]|nr:hypothetical protein [Actinomycetota bacterium]